MLKLSPQRQLLLLFSFYCFSYAFGALFSTVLLEFNSGHMPKLAYSAIPGLALLIPSLIFFKLFSDKRLLDYWSLKTPIRITAFLLTLLLMVCCILLMNWLAEVNLLIPIADPIREHEIKASLQLVKYLQMDSIWQLLLNLVAFAFIPAFFEEVFFRGTMQPILLRYLQKPWAAIFMTAFIFSFLHFQFLGFLPRLLAGVVFGRLFYLTGSLWISITSHALYNGSIVALNYLNQHSGISPATYKAVLLSPYLLIPAALVMIVLFLRIKKDVAYPAKV